MDTLLATILVAFVVVTIGVGLLGISWLIKGKSSLRPGACGRDPTKKKEKSCGTDEGSSCGLCERKDKSEQ